VNTPEANPAITNVSNGNLYLRNGGASDYSDSHILDTALRETYEEMGVDPDDVDVLCRL